MKKGLLIIYSGPSGVGKSTILAEVLKRKELNLAFSVSMTTRLPREGEREGIDYFYVTKEKFEEAIANGEFLEHAKYVDNYYGTPKNYVEKMRNEGNNVILEIDVQGGLQVIEKCPDAVSIFIEPPSIEELRQRLLGRGTEKEEVVNKRVAQAQREIETSAIYKYHVVNEVIETSVETVTDIINKERDA